MTKNQKKTPFRQLFSLFACKVTIFSLNLHQISVLIN